MIRVVVRANENVDDAVRRFRTLIKRSGLLQEMKRRRFYEKPSDAARRIRQRAQRRNRRHSAMRATE